MDAAALFTEYQKSSSDGRSIIDALDLAFNPSITASFMSQLLNRDHAVEKSCTRSSPELSINSPVYRQHDALIVIASPAEPAESFCVGTKTDAVVETSLIEALDLAVDRRIIAAAVLQQPLRRHEYSRSCPELNRFQSPVYGSLTSVAPVPVELPEVPAPQCVVRRKSVWKRTKKFIWNSLTNVARRVCFCQTFGDIE